MTRFCSLYVLLPQIHTAKHIYSLWLVSNDSDNRRLLSASVSSKQASWNLAVVLGDLCKPHLKLLESVDLRILNFEAVLLVTLAMTKRVSDIHAL